jgi:predicted DNA-binding antitoxin AbrB/MazE fold protein
MVIRGRIEKGVVVLEEDVSLSEGTEVSLVVRADGDSGGGMMSAHECKRYRDALERIDALADENPGDTFSGADHDRVLYGEAP